MKNNVVEYKSKSHYQIVVLNYTELNKLKSLQTFLRYLKITCFESIRTTLFR